MKVLVLFSMMWHWKISLTKILVIEPSEISKEKILMTIATPTITGCWVECQQITGCETIGSLTEDNSEKVGFFTCYLLGIITKESKKNQVKDFIKITELRLFPVS